DPQTRMPRIDTNGNAGTVKPRGISGRRFRMIQTPAQTSMNANSVPILVISPTMLSGRKAANSEVNTKNNMFDLYGVLYFGWTSEKTRGTRPSWLIEKNTLDCPSSITRITDEKPARIAIVTNLASQPYPVM